MYPNGGGVMLAGTTGLAKATPVERGGSVEERMGDPRGSGSPGALEVPGPIDDVDD
jgi:hypothetical protein